MFKYVAGSPVQLDVGARVHFLQDQLSFGMNYRNPHFMTFYFRALLDKQWPLLVSFDIATARFQQYSVGSTEVIFGVNLPRPGFIKQQLDNQQGGQL